MLLQQKKLSKWYLLLLLSAGAISSNTVATANEVDLNLLTEINTDRQSVVRRYAEMWEIESGEEQSTLLTAFNEATTQQLLDIDQAAYFDDVRTILLGSSNPSNLAAKGVAQKLGDTAEDLVYTPVVPCRIINTKNEGGPLAANTTRDFKAYGNAATITAQGGNAAGCPSPRGEPSAVHMNVTAAPVGPGAKGNIRVFPSGEAEPQASMVNFELGTNIANAATIQNCRLCADDLTFKANFSGTDVIVDVLGYYYPVNTLQDTDRLALGFGNYNSNGDKLSGTENMGTATVDGNNEYTITITNVTYNPDLYSAFVTVKSPTAPNACNDNLPSTFGSAGKLGIRFTDVEGLAEGEIQKCAFNVAVFKNNSVFVFPIFPLFPIFPDS